MDSLIEGLPDAVMMQCLARVPLHSHPSLQAVSRSWQLCVCSKEFFKLREKIGSSEEWLYVSAYDPDKTWQAFDPIMQWWLTLPTFPSSINRLCNFGTVVCDGKLYVLGGSSDEVDSVTADRGGVIATNEVWMYDPVFQNWYKRASMLVPRARFACCGLDGCIIVAGGHNASRRYVATAEVYSVEQDRWEQIADLCRIMNSPCLGVVLHGKAHVVQYDIPVVQVYDAIQNNWEAVDCILLQGPIRMVEGDLFVVLNSVVTVEQDKRSETIYSWPACFRRQSFGAAKLGEELYVVGGVTFPRRRGGGDLEQLSEVWIFKVDGEQFSWRRGVSMTVLRGSVSGCIVLRL